MLCPTSPRSGRCILIRNIFQQWSQFADSKFQSSGGPLTVVIYVSFNQMWSRDLLKTISRPLDSSIPSSLLAVQVYKPSSSLDTELITKLPFSNILLCPPEPRDKS
jgi:hypothetical protein